jgi:hypothetical protein
MVQRVIEGAASTERAGEPISIARCRDLLGDEAHGLSDEEIDLLRQHANAMANVLIEIFLENRATE